MRNSLLIIALLVVSAVPYCGLLLEDDLRYLVDDGRFVRDNDALVEPGSVLRFFTDPTTMGESWGGIYRPLRTLDFSIDRKLTDGLQNETARLRWLHLRNLGYHLLAVFLLYFLLRRWTGDVPTSLLGAAVFGLHPVQVESVAWITSRGDVMCGALFLLALLSHQWVRGFGGRSLLTAALLVLALFAKEAAIVFVPAAMLSDWCFRDDRRWRSTLRRWPSYLLYAVVCIAYVGLWFYLHRTRGEASWHTPERWGGSFLGSIQGFSLALTYHAGKILLPVDMAFDYYVFVPAAATSLGIVCVVGAIGLLILSLIGLCRRGGTAPFAYLWFLVALFPVSGLAVPIGNLVGERFLYLPMVGVSLWAGSLLARVWRARAHSRVLVVVVLCALGASTFSRAPVFANLPALWGRTQARGGSIRSHLWHGIQTREEAVALLGRVPEFETRGETARARRSREEAEALLEEARGYFDTAAKLWRRTASPPEMALLALSEKALCRYAAGRYEDGMKEAEDILRQKSDIDMARHARTLCLIGLGRHRDAAAEFEFLAVARGEVDSPEAAHVWLGAAREYLQASNPARAVVCLKRSRRIFPLPEAQALLVPLIRDFERRIQPLEQAVKNDPADGDGWLKLASLFAAYGFYDRAEELFDWLLDPARVGRRPHVLYPYALYVWQWRETIEGYERAAEIYREILAGGREAPEVGVQYQVCEKRLEELSRWR